MKNGTVEKIVEERGFGFISPLGERENIFFHVSDLAAELPFDETLMGRRVQFDVEQTAKGQQAVDIQPAK